MPVRDKTKCPNENVYAFQSKWMPNGQQIVALITLEGLEILGRHEVREAEELLGAVTPAEEILLISVENFDRIGRPHRDEENQPHNPPLRQTLRWFQPVEISIYFNDEARAQQCFQEYPG